MLLFVTFCITVLLQIFFYGFLFRKFIYFKPDLQKSVSRQPVSVIICARNEAENLKQLLPLLIAQNYPKYEIILVNDHSTDSTEEVMLNYKDQKNDSEKFSIKMISLTGDDGRRGKKNALTRGIREANYDLLLLTDADCMPVSDNWISLMSSKFAENKDLVLGYGPYRKIKNSFLNKMIRYETLLTAIQYFSYALNGSPYMGVGRNIAYKKELFDKAGGFESHRELLSGDDDLFINAVADSSNTSVCIDKSSFTLSEPETGFKKWFDQKRRHITTSGHYKKNHQLLLGLFYLSQLLFWILAVLLLFKKEFIVATLILIMIRFFVWFTAIYRSSTKLEETDLLLLSPFLEIGVICTQLCIFIANIISPPKKW